MIDSTIPDSIIGKMAVNFKFIDENQLFDAFRILKDEKAKDKYISLGNIFIQNQMITSKQSNLLYLSANFFKIKKLDVKFGLHAIDKGFITKEDLKETLQIQLDEFKKNKLIRLIGDILVENGQMTTEDRDLILFKQNRIQRKTNPKDLKGTIILDNDSESQKTEIEDPTIENETNKTKLELIVSEEGITRAYIKINKGAGTVTVQEVKDYLCSKEITHGIIDDDKIQEFLKSAAADSEPLLVAKGIPPLPGIDASIHYHFDTNYLKIGIIKDDGSIDFKDRGEVPFVKKGDILAEKIPMKEGKPGIDIFGTEIAIPNALPKDIKIWCGTGTEFSEDEKRVVAAIDGQPQITSTNKIFVFPELKINGDVDLKTGNIDFDGNVIISGTIQDSFKVKAGNIKSQEILSAEIENKGDIYVSGGIIGATINSQGSVYAKYIQSSTISAYGDIFVTREIVDSKIYTSGSFNIKSGTIISSIIAAKKGIIANEIGSEVSHPSKLKIGTDEHIQKTIKEIKTTKSEKKKEIEDLKKKIEILDTNLIEIHKKLIDIIQARDQNKMIKNSILERVKIITANKDKKRLEKAQELLFGIEAKEKYFNDLTNSLFEQDDQKAKKLIQHQNDLRQNIKEIKTLENDLDAILEWSNKEKNLPVLKVSKFIYPGTTIQGTKSQFNIKMAYKNVTIKEIKTTDTGQKEECKIEVYTDCKA